MNLQALYDLKERLEYAAIAGTGLMQEDFRLRRAVDALAPLAAASPVFGKISGAAKALLAAPQEERSTRLLDVLSLVDAVVYTQGVSNISGDLVSMEQGAGTYVEASYGELQPLLTALSGSGSGRTSLIRKYYAEHPDYFGDFRVLPYAVKALGDNYAELADLIGEILLRQGAAIIPLLKSGFDPAGKTEMARRVRLIAIMAGESENHWLVGILPDSKKDVREAVIQFLGLHQDNVQLLLDLCQAERGKAREAALRSLAGMEDARAAAFWQTELKKHPLSAAVLSGVDTCLAADLCTAAIRSSLEKLLTTGKPYSGTDLDLLLKLANAFCGKYSEAVWDFWLWVGSRMEQLDKQKPDELVRGCDCSLAEFLQRCMLLTILRNPCYGVLRMARTLSERYSDWFLCCGLMADLLDLDRPPEEVFEAYSPYIVRPGLFTSESEAQERNRIQIMRAFAPLAYDAEKKLFCMIYSGVDPIGKERGCKRHLRWLDARWSTLLTDHRIRQEGQVYDLSNFRSIRKIQTHMESIVMAMIDPENVECCQKCGDYLFKRIKITGKLPNYMDALLRCKWKNWQGLLAHWAQKESQVIYHRAIDLLAQMPVSNREKAAELRSLDELVRSGRISVWNRQWPSEQVEYLIAQLESDENTEIL